MELRRALGKLDILDRLNDVVDLLRGNLGGRIRLWGGAGTQKNIRGGAVLASNVHALIVRDDGGFHALFRNSTDTANVVEILDAGATVSDLVATGNLKWKSGTAFTITLDHTATADRTVTFQDLAGSVALLGAANAGSLLFVDATHDIGASGATRPRDLFLSRTATIGTSIIVPTIGPVSGQQHILPAVASDTVALIAAAQTLTNKTITSPTMSGTWAAPVIDPPTSTGQVTAGSQCAAFAFVTAGGGATLGNNYNITSVTRNAAGDFSIVWDRDFSNAEYAVLVTIEDNALDLVCKVNSKVAGSADIRIFSFAGTLTDPDAFSVSCFGTLT